MKFNNILLVGLTIVFLAGCEKGPVAQKPQSAATPTKEGWQKVATKSVSLQLPKAMKVLDITAANFDKILAALFATNPSLKSMEAQLKQAKDSGMFELFAFGEALSEGFTENINVVVEPLPPSITLEQYETQMKSQLQQMTGSPVKSERKIMGENEFAVTHSELNMALKGAPSKVASIGWVTVTGGKAFVVTFTTLPARHDKFMELAAEVMETFQIR